MADREDASNLLQQHRGFFLCCIVILAIMLVRLTYSFIIHPLRIGWDPALHLQAAQLIIDGKVPYVDMFDVNPPLIWYLDAIPAFLSKSLNFPVTQAFNFFLIGIIIYSITACLLLLFTKARRFDLPIILPFLVGLTLFNFFLRWDFGQREEIFVLLYMPFFLLRWLRWNGIEFKSRNWAILLGLVASIGICLKPYFLIPPTLVELFFLLDKRQWKLMFTPETIAAVVGGVIYCAHFLLVPAQMRESYFGFVVPAFSLGYGFWDTSLGGSFADPDKRAVFYLMTAACVLAVALSRRSTIVLPLAVFVLGANIPYLMQFKGWHYHDQPVYASAFVLAWVELGLIVLVIFQGVKRLTAGKLKWNLKPALYFALPLLALGIAVMDAVDDYTKVTGEDRKFDMKLIGYKGMAPWSDMDNPYTNLVLQYYKLGDKIVFMSNGVAPGYPWLTQLRCQPGSRHLHMVILSVLQYVSELPVTEQTQSLYHQKDRIIREYAEDIELNKPLFVFMQKGPDYFIENYDFVNKYMKEYTALPDMNNFHVYILTERFDHKPKP